MLLFGVCFTVYLLMMSDISGLSELVGVFLLYQLLKKLSNVRDIGSYGNDRLVIFRSKTDPQAEIIKKHFQENFRENDLNIVIKCNLKIVDYIDFTLNLLKSYIPFSNINKKINYIHKGSTHQTSLIK